MKAQIGQTLASTVDATTVVVIRWPNADVELTCGGVAMVEPGERGVTTGQPDPAQSEGTQLGKRYAAEELGIELLCTKAGTGTLAAAGTPLARKAPKPLPASD